ncbi:MAG: hypothetical protein ACI4RT_04360 [Candidatus Spyradenecus sp.]
METFAPFSPISTPVPPSLQGQDGEREVPPMYPVAFVPAPVQPIAPASAPVPAPAAEPLPPAAVEAAPQVETVPTAADAAAEANAEIECLKAQLAEAQKQCADAEARMQKACEHQQALKKAYAEELDRCRVDCEAQMKQHVEDLLRCKRLGIEDPEFIQDFFERYAQMVRAERERDKAACERDKLQAQLEEKDQELQRQSAQYKQAERQNLTLREEAEKLRQSLELQTHTVTQERNARLSAEAKVQTTRQQLEELRRKQGGWEALYATLFQEGWGDCREVAALGDALSGKMTAGGELDPLALQAALALAAWRAMVLAVEVPNRIALCHLELLGRQLAQFWNAAPVLLERLAQVLNGCELMRKQEIRLEVPAIDSEVDTSKVIHRQNGTYVKKVLVWGIVHKGKRHLKAEVE